MTKLQKIGMITLIGFIGTTLSAGNWAQDIATGNLVPTGAKNRAQACQMTINHVNNRIKYLNYPSNQRCGTSLMYSEDIYKDTNNLILECKEVLSEDSIQWAYATRRDVQQRESSCGYDITKLIKTQRGWVLEDEKPEVPEELPEAPKPEVEYEEGDTGYKSWGSVFGPVGNR